MISLLSLSAEEITGIVSGVVAGVVSIIGAIGAIINKKRRQTCANPKCCVTGRSLKPKKKREAKKTK